MADGSKHSVAGQPPGRNLLPESGSLDTEELLARARGGDDDAVRRLFGRHRGRLSRMVAARLDRRVAARLDPSDVVQDALVEASEKLAGFLRERPVPFYTWLRRLTLVRLGWTHRFHLGSRKRSAARDVPFAVESRPCTNAAGAGAGAALERLVDSGTSPSAGAVRDEECERVRAVLARLEGDDRTFIELRYVERLSLGEIADRLGIGGSAVKMRHFRALRRFRAVLEGTDEEPAS